MTLPRIPTPGGDPDDVLQSLMLPEPGLCTEPELYLHAEGGIGFDLPRGEVWLEPGATVRLDGYFNLLSLAKWQENGRLDGLALRVAALGRFELRIMLAGPGQSWDVLHSSVEQGVAGAVTEVPLDRALPAAPGAVLWFEIRALGRCRLRRAEYIARAVPQRARPRLAICITTFRREAAVQDTAERLEGCITRAGWGGRVRVLIVDNGGTLRLPPMRHVEIVANRNLGGAGGFARGLAEARAGGFSHCLFMDDDAAIPLEALHRTEALLSRTTDPARAVAGAMISTRHRWALWEAGARFDLHCRPEQGGRDLRRREQVFALEAETAGTPPPGFYAGFWYFAFPLAGLTADPFPFFVRGDDVSFSLANRFSTLRLNGIVGFQDDFIEKESPTTHYLDLRSHLVHHLALPKLHCGRWRLLRLPLGFLARSVSRLHYDTAEAELLAWSDALSGPGTFASAPDLETRRAELRAMTATEARDTLQTVAPRRLKLRGPIARGLLRATLNGHFLPGSRLWSGRAAIAAEERGTVARVLGAHRYSVRFRADGRGYTVARDNLRAARILLRAARLALRQLRAHAALVESYTAAYPAMTSPQYWAAQFVAPSSGDTARDTSSSRADAA